MKRWLVILLIVLAVIILVSPGIVGRLAEKSVEENLEFATGESDEFVVTTERFERGWFTSEGRHRIELREGTIRSTIEEGLGRQAGVPSLIIDTHVDHGLVPVTSMSRDAGSLKPGLASTVSTMRLDPGNGELIEMPGRVYSEVGLTGVTTSRFLLEAGSRSFDHITAEWQGADILVKTNLQTGMVSVKGEVKRWSVGRDHGALRIGAIEFEGTREHSRYGFGVGDIRMTVVALELDSNLGITTGFDSLSIDASSEIDGDRVNAASTFEISGVTTPGFGDIGVTMDVVLGGLDARSFQDIVQFLRTVGGSADPESALVSTYPAVEAELHRFLAAGAEIRLDRLDVTLPDGEVTTKFRFSLPPADPDAEFSWPGLLLALDASAHIRLPVALFDMAQAATPEAATLVAMGFFRKDGDSYEMQAEYAKGLLTVNGAPMPVPLP
ncbi:MAG: YdgA family protein [Woeseia sp.]